MKPYPGAAVEDSPDTSTEQVKSQGERVRLYQRNAYVGMDESVHTELGDCFVA